MAKTGGGHNAVATAVAEALEEKYDNKVETEVVDAIGDFTPFPIKHLDKTYPWQIKYGGNGYGLGWNVLNKTSRARGFMKTILPAIRQSALDIVNLETDALVAVHPLTVYPCMWAMDQTGFRLPFITMVSDLVVTHALWCSPRTDCLIAPTIECERQAIHHGIPQK